MNSFGALFRTPRPMVDGRLAPDTRSNLFPDVVSQSKRLHLWKLGDPIPSSGNRLLIGVATWSGYDMVLLDMIEEAPEPELIGPLRIDVFDVDSCPDMNALQDYIPGLASAYHTPVVGFWKNGVLARKGSEHEARLLAAQLCDLDRLQLEERIGKLSKAS